MTIDDLRYVSIANFVLLLMVLGLMFEIVRKRRP